jgi:hypothetical protein
MLVFWDHGSGWSGYGLDHTCSTTSTYNQQWGCNMLTLQALAQGALTADSVMYVRYIAAATPAAACCVVWARCCTAQMTHCPGVPVALQLSNLITANCATWRKLHVTKSAMHAGLDAGLNVPDPSTSGRFKLDIIGFDACLMAMYEVGSTLAPYGRYLLASELLEPGHGWDYSALGSITQGVTAAGAPATSLSAQDVGDLFIANYFDQVGIGRSQVHVKHGPGYIV